jgi:hypothetical protein
MGTGYRSRTTRLEHAEHPDLRPLRAVEPHRLASQAAESAIELARCLRDLPTAEAAFAAYEWLRWPRVEMISCAAAKTNQAKAGMAAPGSGMPSPEQMFAPVHKHLIDWDAPAGAWHGGAPAPRATCQGPDTAVSGPCRVTGAAPATGCRSGRAASGLPSGRAASPACCRPRPC